MSEPVPPKLMTVEPSALLVKNVLILATATSVHWTLTPPNPPIGKEEFVKRTLFEKSVRLRAFMDKTLIWIVSILDIAYPYAISQYPSSSLLCPSSGGQAVSTFPHPILMVGAFLCVASSACRIWCYAALGNLFDFEVRIKSNHRLVTSGPYSFVRHPSYTALFASYLGASMVICSPGHWLRECGISNVVGLLALTSWFLECAWVLVAISKRLGLEDQTLRGRFGREWEDYARRVPYRLLPGIY